MIKLDQGTLTLLKHERAHMQMAIEDYSICNDRCSDKSIRREMEKQLNMLNSRKNEFDRVLSILHISL